MGETASHHHHHHHYPHHHLLASSRGTLRVHAYWSALLWSLGRLYCIYLDNSIVLAPFPYSAQKYYKTNSLEYSLSLNQPQLISYPLTLLVQYSRSHLIMAQLISFKTSTFASGAVHYRTARCTKLRHIAAYACVGASSPSIGCIPRHRRRGACAKLRRRSLRMYRRMAHS